MTTVNVNVTDVAGAYGPNDKVIFYSPVYREGSSGEIISTAQAVFSLQGGPGTVELEPGPVRVKFQVQGISDIKDKEGVVPDTGPVDLYDVIGSSLIYTPPVVNRALEIIHAERDTLLDEMATTVSEAVDGELGDAVRSAQTAAQVAAQEAVSADNRATSAENKVDSYTPRVVTLEAMAGLSPESPVDGQTANLIENETTLARAAVNAAISKIVEEGAGTVYASTRGVVADGVTDDQPAIQALIEEVTAAGGGRIILPPGKIRLNEALVARNNVLIEGSGMDITVLEPRKIGIDVSWTTPENTIKNAHFRHFTIDGQYRTGRYKGYHGEYHERCSWYQVSARNTGMTGLGPDYLRSCVIDSCFTENTGLDNDGTEASGNGIGIGTGRSVGREDFVIISSTAVNAKRYGIMVEGPYDQVGMKIIGSSAMDCHSGGFGIGAAAGTVVIGNTAIQNHGNGFELSHLTLAGVQPDGAIITGNVAQANGGHGIWVNAQTTAPDVGGMIMTDNRLGRNLGCGIRVDFDMSKITLPRQVSMWRIAGNIFDRNARGIEIKFGGTVGTVLPTAWAINDNVFYMSATIAPYADIHIIGKMDASSVSGNIFHHNSGMVRGGIILGEAGTTTVLSRCRIQGNINKNRESLHLTNGATTPGSLVKDNLPEALSQTGSVTTNVRTLTTTGNVALTDHTIISSGAGSLYLPSPTTASVGMQLAIRNSGTIVTTLRFLADGTIDGVTTKDMTPGSSATLVNDGTMWRVTESVDKPMTRTVTATATITSTDHTIVSNGAGTVFLPAPGDSPAGREIVVKNIKSTPVTVSVTGGSTIDGATSRSLPQWAAITLKNIGGWVITSTVTPAA